jgi:potassium efflux system protein
MRRIIKLSSLVIFLLAIFCLNDGFAQNKKKRYHSRRDSLRATMHFRDSLMRSFKKSDTSINGLLRKLQEYNASVNEIKANLKQGFDTTEIGEQLPRFEKRIVTIKALIDNDKSGTLRYLYAIRGFLSRINEQLDVNQDQLKDINDKLLQNQTDLSALFRDSSLRMLPADSALRSTFLIQKRALITKWRKVDSTNKKLFLKIGNLQNRVTAVYIAILDETDRINLKINDFGIKAFTGESDYIWNMPPNLGNEFNAALTSTISMNKKLFSFFVGRDVLIHLGGVALFILFFSWIYSNQRKIIRLKETPGTVLDQTIYVVKHPFLSTLIVAFAVAPNFYDHPPVVFLEAFFTVLIIAVLILVKKIAAPSAYQYLHKLFWITLIFSLSNLFISVSGIDRIVILLLSALSIWVSYQFLQSTKNIIDGLFPYSRVITRIFITLQSLSFICNVFGRFSLAKIIGVTAVYNLWMALALYFLVQIIMEGLFLQLEASKSKNSFTSYIDFKLLRDKFRNILNIIAAILWLVMLTQNLDIEDAANEYIGDFLSGQHTLGSTDAKFTFQSIIIFIAVLWLSSVVSKIISYLYDIAGQHDLDVLKKKNRTSTLLIRIGVITVGFFLAVAASNFPLDKITIIISAFGIGIGFGLQNIVNNLVSGLILAFEKPVQIGDIIEVDNRSGTIKEIGIRSSKIATSDGAEVIVPNGDLISHHVINWTLSNSNRRVELIIGVAYGSDIEKVKGLLREILVKREDIMRDPAPLVFLHNLNQSSVDFRILFWADDITHWLELKSHVLSDIYTIFSKEGIEIPFPQQNVHLTLPEQFNLPNATQTSPDPKQ